MRFFTLALLLVVALPAVAAAQSSAPGASPPDTSRPETAAPAVVDPYDPWVVAGVSLAGSAVAIGTGMYAIDQKNEDLLMVSGIALLALPTAGHWYVGETWSTGLLIRGAGLAVTAALLSSESECESGECHDGSDIAAVATGAAIMLVGAAVDAVAAPLAARRANRAHRARVTIAPQVAPGHAGLAIAGSF